MHTLQSLYNSMRIFNKKTNTPKWREEKTRAVPVAKEILDVVVTHENKIDWEKPRERKIDPPTTTTLYRSDLLFLDGGVDI